jgi:hypothetical protein
MLSGTQYVRQQTPQGSQKAERQGEGSNRQHVASPCCCIQPPLAHSLQCAFGIGEVQSQGRDAAQHERVAAAGHLVAAAAQG